MEACWNWGDSMLESAMLKSAATEFRKAAVSLNGEVTVSGERCGMVVDVGDRFGLGEDGAVPVAYSGTGASEARLMRTIEGGAERDAAGSFVVLREDTKDAALGREGERVRILLAISIKEEDRERGGEGGTGLESDGTRDEGSSSFDAWRLISSLTRRMRRAFSAERSAFSAFTLSYICLACLY